jgi:hypothetical protein
LHIGTLYPLSAYNTSLAELPPPPKEHRSPRCGGL